VLRPSLSADWVLDLPPNLESELRQELDSLSGLPSARGYRSWVLALRTLASLRRGRAQDGFRWPRTAADRSRYEAAARQLRSAAVDLNVPTVWSFTAAVEAMLCNLDAAEAALAKAVDEFGVNRMSMLVGQEIALRRGNTAAVKQMVHAALARPQARGDAWLAELAGGLRKPPACADR
jgi:hypothetical protein